MKDAKPHYVGLVMRREAEDMEEPILETVWRAHDVGCLAEISKVGTHNTDVTDNVHTVYFK